MYYVRQLTRCVNHLIPVLSQEANYTRIMKISKYILLLGVAMSLTASAQQINPITQAMLDGYEQLLKENPNDYFTLYERASQYYRLSRYDMALNDIKRSIAATPAKEKDQLAAEYSLCADIYIQLKEYKPALDAVDSALKLTPNSYPLLYMKGNICLYLNDLVQAESMFKAMARVQSRSQEAMFGLAKIAVLQGDFAKAEEYMSQAEKLDPANYLTYCRLGDLHREMKLERQSAADYISAFCLNNSSERPMAAMIDLALVNYPAAAEAIDYALSHTGNTVPLYFLKGNIALTNGHYSDAYEAYRHLTDNKETATVTLAPAMAKICLGLGHLREADDYANQALKASNSEMNNLTKAYIEEAKGNIASAIIYAKNALRANPQSAYAAVEAASLLMADKNYAEALSILNEAILGHPEDVSLMLLRGYLNGNGLSGAAPSTLDYVRAANISVNSDTDLTCRAIAQSLSGKKLDAAATIAPILSKADRDASAAVLAAQYFLNDGDRTSATKYMEIAGQLGFEDAYILQYSVNPIFSLKALNK